MQTFLPYESFAESAACLDMKRLGKQRVETLQILYAIRFGSRWSNHPAVRMWRNYSNTLIDYGIAICNEWIKRGYRDTCKEKILQFNDSRIQEHPFWLGADKFHNSHKSNLMRKMPEWYKQYDWKVADNLPYVWPL